MSTEDTKRAADLAVKAAAAAPQGKPIAVVVIVREIPDGALSVASNILTDRAAMLRILKEGSDAIRGDARVIV
jgi:hypothetical protein